MFWAAVSTPWRKVDVGRIGGKTIHALEEGADLLADTGSVVGEKSLHLVHGVHVGLRIALLLSFLADLKVQQAVAQTLDALDLDAAAQYQIALDERVGFL